MPNMADLSTATKVLLAAGVLMFIDLFLSWQKVCADTVIGEQCFTQSGWHGWGTLVGLLLIALIIWEGITLAGIAQNLNVPVAASMVSAALAVAILLFTILKFLVDNEQRSWPAWVGLLLAIAIAVGGWLKWKETPETAAAAPAAPPPPPPAEPPAPPPA